MADFTKKEMENFTSQAAQIALENPETISPEDMPGLLLAAGHQEDLVRQEAAIVNAGFKALPVQASAEAELVLLEQTGAKTFAQTVHQRISRERNG